MSNAADNKTNKKAIEIGDVFSGGAYFNWGAVGIGFGQLSFSVDPSTQKVSCMNECMNRESVRKILHAFADHIADNAEINEC